MFCFCFARVKEKPCTKDSEIEYNLFANHRSGGFFCQKIIIFDFFLGTRNFSIQDTMYSRWKEATTYMRFAFISFVLAFILYVIGFSTFYWGHFQTTESSTKVIGLWKYLLEYKYQNKVHEARNYISSAQIPKYIFNSGKSQNLINIVYLQFILRNHTRYFSRYYMM